MVAYKKWGLNDNVSDVIWSLIVLLYYCRPCMSVSKNLSLRRLYNYKSLLKKDLYGGGNFNGSIVFGNITFNNT